MKKYYSEIWRSQITTRTLSTWTPKPSGFNQLWGLNKINQKKKLMMIDWLHFPYFLFFGSKIQIEKNLAMFVLDYYYFLSCLCVTAAHAKIEKQWNPPSYSKYLPARSRVLIKFYDYNIHVSISKCESAHKYLWVIVFGSTKTAAACEETWSILEKNH